MLFINSSKLPHLWALIATAFIALAFMTISATADEQVIDGTYRLSQVDGKSIDDSELRLVVRDGKPREWWSRNGSFNVFGTIAPGEKLLINDGKASFVIETVSEEALTGEFTRPRGKNNLVLTRE